MKTFLRAVIVMVGSTGLAAAPAYADTRSGDAKMADSKPAGMPEMKPPPELAELAKASVGTWKCKGSGMDHTMKMAELTGTMKYKLSLDSWWLQGSFESNMGKEPFHLETFTTFDPASKKWKRVMVETGGGWSSGESAGLKDGKLDWDLTSHSPMGDSMFRDHAEVDPKAGTKMTGEFSLDKGKTWTTVYEMTCKK